MNRKNWVSKLHDYVDEEGYNAVSKLIMKIEKGTVPLEDYTKDTLNLHEAYRRDIKEHFLLKSTVNYILETFEKEHFEEGSDQPSMTIHKSDFKNLKRKLGLR